MRAALFLPVLAVGCQTPPPPLRAVTPASLLKTLPPDLLPPHREIPAEANGWLLAQKAAARTNAPKGWSDLVGRDLLTPADLALARRSVAAFAPRLDLLRRALTEPAWEQPRPTPDALNFPEYAALKELAKAAVLRAELALVERRPGDAATDLLMVRDLGARLADSGSAEIAYLVGVALRAIGNRALQRAAWHPAMTPAVLKRALASVPEGALTDPALARALQDDVRDFFVPNLAGMKGPVLDPKDDSVDGRVFRGHPDPFDRTETLRLVAEGLRAAVANTDRSWKDQTDVAALAAGWTAGFTFEEDAETPLTEAQIVAYRAAAAKVGNPFGRNTAATTVGTIMVGINGLSFRIRADDSATRATLLLARAAKRSGGTLPKALPESVRDPFSGAPLGYDPARALLWSVGPDGRDDGGDGLPGAFQSGKDYVWSARGRNSGRDRDATPPPLKP